MTAKMPNSNLSADPFGGGAGDALLPVSRYDSASQIKAGPIRCYWCGIDEGKLAEQWWPEPPPAVGLRDLCISPARLHIFGRSMRFLVRIGLSRFWIPYLDSLFMCLVPQ